MFWNKKDKTMTEEEIVELVTANQFNRHKDHIEKNRKLYCEGLLDLNKRTDKLEKILISLCKHKDCNIRQLTMTEFREQNRISEITNIDSQGNGFFSFFGETLSIYQKTCSVCGNIEHITKKQYLTYKKETIESSLKECE